MRSVQLHVSDAIVERAREIREELIHAHRGLTCATTAVAARLAVERYSKAFRQGCMVWTIAKCEAYERESGDQP